MRKMLRQTVALPPQMAIQAPLLHSASEQATTPTKHGPALSVDSIY